MAGVTSSVLPTNQQPIPSSTPRQALPINSSQGYSEALRGPPEAQGRLGEVSERESTRNSEEERQMTDWRALFLLQESAVVPPGSWPREVSVLDSLCEV